MFIMREVSKSKIKIINKMSFFFSRKCEFRQKKENENEVPQTLWNLSRGKKKTKITFFVFEKKNFFHFFVKKNELLKRRPET